MAKVIINENEAKKIIGSMLLEDKNSQEEIAREVKKLLKNDSDVTKDLDKHVKEIVAQCVNNLFKTLWYRHNFYEDEIKR